MSDVIKRYNENGDTVEVRKINDDEFMLQPNMVSDTNLHQQCNHCSFMKLEINCPRDDDQQLSCNKDLTSAWVKVDTPMLDKPQGTKAEVQIGHIDGSAAYTNLERYDYWCKSQPKSLEQPAGRKYDSGKPMYALMPIDAEEEVVKVLTEGAIKYNEPISEENWRKVDNLYFRYYGAARRHMQADRKGELIDVDVVNPDGSISKGTNCYHLACAIASLMFMLQKRIEDDKKESK